MLALPVYVPSLIWASGYGALSSVMVLAALSLGYSQAWASAIAGISGLVGVLTGPRVGHWITRVGDRRAFLVGSGLAIGALIGTLVALGDPGRMWSMVVYMVGIIALSVSSNIWSLARQSYVAESVPMSWRARGMSMLGGMLRLGQLIGPAIGSLAIAAWGMTGSFVLQAVTVVIALGFVLAFTLPSPEKLSDPREEAPVTEEVDPDAPRAPSPSSIPRRLQREHADRVATVLLGAGIVVLGLVRTNRTVVIPLWGSAMGIPDHSITATFAASAVMDALMFYPGGRIADRFGRRAALLPTLLIMGAGFFLMAMWTSPVGFVVSACLIGFGNGFGSGIVMTMGADLSPDVDRSDFLGLWQSISLIGSTAGPFLVSALVTVFGTVSGAWVTGALSIAGAVWFALVVPPAYRRLGVDDRGRPLRNG